MAASQPSATVGASANAEHSNSASPSGSGAGAGGAGSGASNYNAASVISKSGTPQASATTTTTTTTTAVPHRDKASFDQLMIERYVTRDWVSSAALIEAQRQTQEYAKLLRGQTENYKLIRTEHKQSFPRSRIYGEGYSGYGNGTTETGGPARILYPANKPRPGKRTTPPVKYSKKDMMSQAEMHEELVPVRLDVDWDKIRLHDTFTFNLHERVITAAHFAAQLVEDMGIRPPADKPVCDQVLQQIEEQLTEFYPFAFCEDDALDPELPYSAYKNDEMRILIKLNITIGVHTLMDQFEWEINNPMNSPEEFAASMARDLSLSGEFKTAIAHCIREQAQLFTRSLYSVGHPFDGRPIEDPELKSAFLPSPLPAVFRPQQQAKDYSPYLYENTEAELEKTEMVFSREQRRQKRSTNRRGGPQLPDLRERQRTLRTSIISSVLPGGARNVEESRLLKRTTGLMVSGGRGRRGPRDGEISDSEDSDVSPPDSPAMSQLQGTARTRGMRGAASAAAQRMANMGRLSETPEATIHHHEPRTSRRLGREFTREDTEDPQQLIVTLIVPPTSLRKLMRDLRNKQATPTPSEPATPAGPNLQRAPSASTLGSMGPPPSAPSVSNTNAPFNKALAGPAGPSGPSGPSSALIGSVAALPPPPPGQPQPPAPPPPDWLTICLQTLQREWPHDQFEVTMRYCAVNAETNTPMPLPPQGRDVEPGTLFVYLPRIRCLDCPGKLYTPGPGTTLNNFEVHLRNRAHRDRVSARAGRLTGPLSDASAAGVGVGVGIGAVAAASAASMLAPAPAPAPPLAATTMSPPDGPSTGPL